MTDSPNAKNPIPFRPPVKQTAEPTPSPKRDRSDREERFQSGREDGENQPPEFSDESLALRFADEYVDDMRYVAAWRKWLIFDEQTWDFDATLAADDRSRRVCRESAALCEKPHTAASIASGRTIGAVERLARADRRLAATVEQFDAAPNLLNTPGMTIDLRTGDSRAPRREDYFTKCAGAAPRGECPQWLKFLDRVTGGDRNLQDYLKRVAGYCLTGHVSEHALFFLYGTGGNGKSVFVNTLAFVLGDYMRTAPIELLLATHNERHPTEIAMLRGARLVICTETDEGRRWAESRVKALTGGDRIAARYMRADFFEFQPTFKLVVVGNHKPSLRNVDEARRRRLHMITFPVTISDDEKDETLPDKLKAEGSGILQWAIDGCIDWRERGLAPPESVTRATVDYLDGEDALGLWIEDARGEAAWSATSHLYENWKAWAERSGEYVGTKKRFSQNLPARGFALERRNQARGFRDLGVVSLD